MKKVQPKKKRKSKIFIYFLWGMVFLLLIGLATAVYFSVFYPGENFKTDNYQTGNLISAKQTDSNFVKAVSQDSTDNYITFSSYNDFVNYDTQSAESLHPRYTGRRINIAIIGLDSRIGTNSNHADANHILSILVDSGKIEIISVPRDTPANAGFDDSTGQNKLTVVRAVLGRNAHLSELARIAQLDQIHYYVEVVFSQVVGFLEFLGYRDPKSTLQLLRSRKGLGGDDYQRCYNQAQFIRQMILKHFNKINDGLFGDLLIRGGLSLVSTNLTYDVVDRIVSKLNMYGFPRSQSDIYIKIRPPMQMKLKVYDFTDQQIVDRLIKQIENFNIKNNERDTNRVDVSALLHKTLSLAEADTAKNPKRVVTRLSNFYSQRAWLQIEDNKERETIRQRFENCLVSAYKKLNQPSNALRVQEEIRLEREFFNLKHK